MSQNRGELRNLLLISIGVFLAGCSKGSFSARSGHRADELHLVYQSSPSTFDPSLSQDIYTNDLMGLVFEGLVGWDENSHLEARLAETWDISKDGKTYTFHLRKDVHFSNGKELTAEDVKWSWEHNSRSAFANGYLGDIAKTEVVDPLTLRVELNGPKPAFLGKLAYPVAFVMPKEIVPIDKQILKPEEMIGTGAFILDRYTPDQQLDLRANPSYRRGKPELPKLTIRIVKDSATRVNLFRGGQLDVASLSQDDVAGFNENPQYKDHLIHADRAAVIYLGMNGHIYKPFADPRVRRAFVMAVDRDFIVDKLLAGAGRKADGILPPAISEPGRTKAMPPFDPAGAKALLAQSGWAGKMPALDLWVNDSNRDRKAIAEYAVAQFKQNLGVDVQIRLADATSIIHKATRRELGFFYGSWYADYLDPENFLSVMLADYGQNRTDYNNPAFSALCRQADSEGNAKKRAQLYAQAEDIALQDCPWMPLYFPQEVIAVQPWVSGLKQNLFGFLPPVAPKLSARAK